MKKAQTFNIPTGLGTEVSLYWQKLNCNKNVQSTKVLGFGFSFHWQIFVQIRLWGFISVTKFRVSHLSIDTTSTKTFTALRQFTFTFHFITFHLLHFRKVCKYLCHVPQPKLLGHLSYLHIQPSGMIHTISVGHHEMHMVAITCNQTSMLFITALTCWVLNVVFITNKRLPWLLGTITIVNSTV
jgi:hypothetical protein